MILSLGLSLYGKRGHGLVFLSSSWAYHLKLVEKGMMLVMVKALRLCQLTSPSLGLTGYTGNPQKASD